MLEYPGSSVTIVIAWYLPNDNHIIKLVLEMFLLSALTYFIKQFLWQTRLAPEEVQEVRDVEQWIAPVWQFDIGW